MKKLLSIVMPILVCVLMAGCAKNGTNGTNGATGPAGPMGNANIKDSVFTIMPAGWSANSNYDYVIITDPQITSTIMSSGEVLVYWSANGGVNWDNLNWSSENPTGYLMEFNYQQGQVGIYFSPAGSTPNTVFGGTSSMFKVVCMTNAAMHMHPNTNWADYNQVMPIVEPNK